MVIFGEYELHDFKHVVIKSFKINLLNKYIF
jgi:hypothetical protein